MSSFQRLSRRFQATFSHLTRLDYYTNYYTGSVAGGQLVSPARQLETDLESKTGLALADYDVLAQLAVAGGFLRKTELSDRALISRSGMARRVASARS